MPNQMTAGIGHPAVQTQTRKASSRPPGRAVLPPVAHNGLNGRPQPTPRGHSSPLAGAAGNQSVLFDGEVLPPGSLAIRGRREITPAEQVNNTEPTSPRSLPPWLQNANAENSGSVQPQQNAGQPRRGVLPRTGNNNSASNNGSRRQRPEQQMARQESPQAAVVPDYRSYQPAAAYQPPVYQPPAYQPTPVYQPQQPQVREQPVYRAPQGNRPEPANPSAPHKDSVQAQARSDGGGQQRQSPAVESRAQAARSEGQNNSAGLNSGNRR